MVKKRHRKKIGMSLRNRPKYASMKHILCKCSHVNNYGLADEIQPQTGKNCVCVIGRTKKNVKIVRISRSKCRRLGRGLKC